MTNALDPQMILDGWLSIIPMTTKEGYKDFSIYIFSNNNHEGYSIDGTSIKTGKIFTLAWIAEEVCINFAFIGAGKAARKTLADLRKDVEQLGVNRPLAEGLNSIIENASLLHGLVSEYSLSKEQLMIK